MVCKTMIFFTIFMNFIPWICWQWHTEIRYSYSGLGVCICWKFLDLVSGWIALWITIGKWIEENYKLPMQAHILICWEQVVKANKQLTWKGKKSDWENWFRELMVQSPWLILIHELTTWLTQNEIQEFNHAHVTFCREARKCLGWGKFW